MEKINRGLVVFLFLALSSVPAFSWEGIIALPQTGQTKCYDSLNNEIPCLNTGQDGEIRAGVAWPNPRFQVNNDGTILDKLTGLIWLKDTSCLTPIPGKTWSQALQLIADFNANPSAAATPCQDYGPTHYTDWRMPNVNEFRSLANDGLLHHADWLEANGFVNVKRVTPDNTPWYWTSTTQKDLYSADRAWIQCLDSGLTSQFNKAWGFSPLVWVVRDGPQDTPDPVYPANLPKTGQTSCYDEGGAVITCAGTGQDGELQRGVAWPTIRFRDNGDQTVTDYLTGLMWTKDSRTPYPTGCTGGMKNWQDALSYIDCLNEKNYRSYGDWRMPNAREMQSLTDYSRYQMALPAGHPFTIPNDYYLFWTSTTTEYFNASGDYAWVWDGIDGSLGGDLPKGGEMYTWPVRFGQPRVITTGKTGTCSTVNAAPNYGNGYVGAAIGAEACAQGNSSEPVSETSTVTAVATLPYGVGTETEAFFNVSLSGYLSCSGQCRSRIDYTVSLFDDGVVVHQVTRSEELLNVTQLKTVDIRESFSFRARPGHEYVLQMNQDLSAYASGGGSTARADFLKTAKALISTVEPPVANAGSDQYKPAYGTLVTLNGSDSYDPGGHALTYSWQQIAGTPVTLTTTTPSSRTFTPASDGTYVFELVVNNGTLDSLPDTVTIFIGTTANIPPVANAGTNQYVETGTLVNLNGSASYDPDNNTPLAYAWELISKPGGSAAVLSSTDTVTTSMTPDLLGDYVAQLVVTDSLGSSSQPDLVFITAYPGALPAAFGKSSPANGAAAQPTSLTLSWGSSAGAASYQYCLDTSNDNTCSGSWTSTGTSTSAAISGLNQGTAFFWQVRAVNAVGNTQADGETWWSFTTQTQGSRIFIPLLLKN